MTKQHKLWLEQGAGHAAILLNEKSTYANAIDGLMFFYARKAVVMHGGTIAAASRAVRVDDVSLARRVRIVRERGMQLTTPAQLECERWATMLAMNGASYLDALFIFARSLLETAIAQSDGNRCEAARRLGVHRNTVWRIPKVPQKHLGSRQPRRRPERGAAA